MTSGAWRTVEDGWEDVPVDGPETLAERRLLASFGSRARAVNLSRVLRLSELLDRVEAGALDETGRSEAENLAHQVAGSAGTFGHADASREALVVEHWFAEHRPAAPGTDPSDTVEVRGAVERLRVGLGG